MLYFFEIWIGNIVHGGNPLYGVVDCFRHSRGLKWPIWTKFFACGIFYVYDGHPLKFLSIFFYSDPLKKVVLSEVGAFSKNVVRTTFLAWFFPFTNHATSLHARNVVRTTFMAGHYKSYWQVTSPMPDCFAQNAARAAILAGWSNPNPMYLPCIYVFLCCSRW